MFQRRRRLVTVILTAVLAFFLVGSAANAATNRDQVFKTMQNVFEVVEAYHKDGADLDRFFKGAVNGGLEALGDPYTNYFPPEEFASFLDSLNGQVTGIGIYLEQDGNYVIVAAPIKGSPAFRAGLQTGDRILEADGTSLVGGTVEKAGQLIRGKEGTEVLLKIERPSESRTFEVRIVRAIIQIPQVETKVLDDNVGYIALSSFGNSAGTEFFEAVGDLKKQGVTSMILDLRQNPGGYVDAAVAIASGWVPKGEPIVVELGKNGEEVLRSRGTLINLPTVVLVDGGSASAAEILAGAIQDYGSGKLVGTKTFGKGTVQQIIFMADSGGIKVTIAEYLTGKGRQVDKLGITPDLVVEPFQPDSTITKPMTLTRLLSRNMVGLDVLQVQNRLAYLGYETETDGVMGRKTMNAIFHLRLDADLPLTSVVDDLLVTHLNQQVSEETRRLQAEDPQLMKAVELLTHK